MLDFKSNSCHRNRYKDATRMVTLKSRNTLYYKNYCINIFTYKFL